MRRFLIAVALSAVFPFLASAPAAADVWTHARGNPAQDGHIDVATAPAAQPAHTVPRLGGVYAGVSPVFAADGTVYVAAGRHLRAFTADGVERWTSALGGFGSAIASPVVAGDGSIYVASSGLVTDRTARATPRRYVSNLSKFSPTGALVWSRELPPASSVPNASMGRAAGAPSIVQAGGQEFIALEVYYPEAPTPSVRLMMFTPTSAVVANRLITQNPPPSTTSESSIGLCDVIPCMDDVFGLNGRTVPAPAPLHIPVLLPHLAQYASGDSSVIVAADALGDIVGYTIHAGPTNVESFRMRLLTGDANSLQVPLYMSSPAVLRGGQSVTVVAWAESTYLWVAGPGRVAHDRIAIPRSFASPTVTGNGDIIVVNAEGGATRIALNPTPRVIGQTEILGASYAPAAASRTHIYISSENTLTTLDAQSFARTAVYQWSHGGLSPPAISPNGRVYAIANDTLYIFAPPACVGIRCNNTNVGGPPRDTQRAPRTRTH